MTLVDAGLLSVPVPERNQGFRDQLSRRRTGLKAWSASLLARVQVGRRDSVDTRLPFARNPGASPIAPVQPFQLGSLDPWWQTVAFPGAYSGLAMMVRVALVVRGGPGRDVT